MTQFEYYALIDIIFINWEEDDLEHCETQEVNSNLNSQIAKKGNKTGRKKRKKIRFHESHPLYNSHVQVLKAKQATVIINGHPPTYPGNPPEKSLSVTTPFEDSIFEEKKKKMGEKMQEIFNLLLCIIFTSSNSVWRYRNTRYARYNIFISMGFILQKYTKNGYKQKTN